jgi:hypothetical protein
MKTLFAVLLVGFAILVPNNGKGQPSDAAVETLVCVRHGEKPRGGLGQLTCRGLNRALALPNVLLAKYGAPVFIFAPNPSEKDDGLGHYNYIRPLMTIEPTAIRCGLPVNTEFGYLQIDRLEHELGKPEYRRATVFVAWEHALLDAFVKDFVKAHGGNPAQVPSWAGSDYDSIFVVKVTRSGGHESAAFSIDHEGLNNLSDNCP